MHYDYGLTGIAWATVGNYAFNLVAIFLYIYFSKNENVKKTWSWITPKGTFTGILKTFAVYINGALMVTFSWWSVEILSLMAGQFDTNSIAVHVTLINFLMIMLMVPYSISVVVANLIG